MPTNSTPTYIAEWRRKNPEKDREHRIKYRSGVTGRASILYSRAKNIMERKGLKTDLTKEHIKTLLQESLDKGEVSLYPNRPDTASMDQIIASGGYTKDNIRIVPHWYNQAKFTYSDEQLISAMERYGFVRPKNNS